LKTFTKSERSFRIGASFSGYRLINLRFAPVINLSVSPSDQPSDFRRRSLSSSAFQLHYQPLPTVRSFDLPSDQPPTCVGDQPSSLPSSQPLTCVSSQLSSPTFASTCGLRRLPILWPAFRLVSGLRLQSVFQLNLPADFQLAPSSNLPVPPSNLTSDSHRPLIPSALPSGQSAACAAYQPSSPA
jgi:hypothetical protein